MLEDGDVVLWVSAIAVDCEIRDVAIIAYAEDEKSSCGCILFLTVLGGARGLAPSWAVAMGFACVAVSAGAFLQTAGVFSHRW